MSKLNLAAQLEAERRPQLRTFDQWLSELDAEDRAALEAARTDPEISNAALSRVIVATGGTGDKNRIAVWRRG